VADLLGFPFHRLTEAACVEHILDALESGRGGWVVTPNLDILRMLSASRALWTLFRKADLLVADGMPIVWASRILGDPLPERVAGSSLISSLSAGAARRGRSVYLLGGNPGSAEACARELVRRSPGLRVAGTDCPPHGFERDPREIRRIAGRLARARPDIVYVALGCPKQEHLIQHLRPAAPGAWYLGVGISFSYVAGDVRRAPAWMRRWGLEWIFRLAQEPRRLARRYLRNDIPFGLRLAGLALWARLTALIAPGRRPPRLIRPAAPRRTASPTPAPARGSARRARSAPSGGPRPDRGS
jgi:N-acetylglucosaminyldiphosphoundecaprenol N-acetyl-beta-D-mannosaminyltransferase